MILRNMNDKVATLTFTTLNNNKGLTDRPENRRLEFPNQPTKIISYSCLGQVKQLLNKNTFDIVLLKSYDEFSSDIVANCFIANKLHIAGALEPKWIIMSIEIGQWHCPISPCQNE